MPAGPPEHKQVSFQDAPHELAKDLETHNFAAAREVLEQFNGFIKTSVAQSAVSEINSDRKKNPNLPVVEFHTGTDKNGEYLSDITVQSGNGKPETAYKDNSTHLPPEPEKKPAPAQTKEFVEWLRNHLPWTDALKKASQTGEK
jgi:hypothetical protein